MKKILTIFLLLLTFGVAQAQSDATWEETVNFIKKYKSYIHFDVRCGVFGNTTNWDLTISKNSFKWELYNYSKGYRSIGEAEINTTKLKNIEITDYGIKLYFIGEYYKSKCDCEGQNPMGKWFKRTNDSYSYSGNSIGVHIDDEEMRERLFKAFSHLAKLATEKRAKERAASGDKF